MGMSRSRTFLLQLQLLFIQHLIAIKIKRDAKEGLEYYYINCINNYNLTKIMQKKVTEISPVNVFFYIKFKIKII